MLSCTLLSDLPMRAWREDEADLSFALVGIAEILVSTMLARPPSPPPDSGWRSIRPYTSRLTISTSEITSVSVTFILKATLDVAYVKRPFVADNEPDDAHDIDMLSGSGDRSFKQGISYVLRTGLAVKVNAAPWKKVVIYTEDEEEEAIVTVYDLIPATFYDIDLTVAAGEDSFSGAIITASSPPEPGGSTR